MAITIKFNLKIIQIDIVNAFVHYNFNKVISIKLLLEFNKGKIDKVLYLKKSPIQTTTIPSIIIKESYKLIKRIRF
jgi:hypothetical protein